MKIDRESKSETVGSKAQHVRKILETSPNQSAPHQRNARGPRPTIKPMIDAATAEPVDIFGAEPLGIFNPENKGSVQRMNVTWDKLYERELKLAVTHPPQNYFEEQILWTEQGKIWKFPIDNEQGMEIYSIFFQIMLIKFFHLCLQEWKKNKVYILLNMCFWKNIFRHGVLQKDHLDISWNLYVLAFRKIRT